MSITADLTRLIVGLFFGIVLPRIPLLFFTRFLNLERDLTPHPDPIPIGVPLVQRLLLMRRIHTMCWLIALLPLGLGFLILKSSPAPFAVGLVAGASLQGLLCNPFGASWKYTVACTCSFSGRSTRNNVMAS